MSSETNKGLAEMSKVQSKNMRDTPMPYGIRYEDTKGTVSYVWFHTTHERDLIYDNRERLRCNQCGDLVGKGTAKFVNRVPDLNTVNDRIDIGRPFPKGDYICAECDNGGTE